MAESYDGGHAPSGVPGWVAASARVQDVNDEWAFWSGTPRDADMPGIAANAKAVLREDPLEPAPLYELGMVAERRRAGSGKALFELAARVSRREALNELELEGNAAESGNNALAIAHIDRAVLVVPNLMDKVFAPLVPAIGDPAILDIFKRYADRPWYSTFIWRAMKDGGDPEAIGQLIQAGHGHLAQASMNELNARLVAVLVSQGDIAAALRAFRNFAPDVKAGLENMGFSPVARDPNLAPLSWQALDSDAVNSRFDGGGLSLEVLPEQAAQASVRITLLAAGTYVFSQTLIYADPASRAGIVWDVACSGERHQPIWHQQFIAGETGRSATRATITVPDDCGAQVWSLKAVGATGVSPSTVTVADLGLQRQ